jgi:hypothetical protein
VRPFINTYSEAGGVGGDIYNWRGASTTYSGAGGGAYTYSQPYRDGYGGTSTYGGYGGNGIDKAAPYNGGSPGGGSGGSYGTCSNGGNGMIVVTWT